MIIRHDSVSTYVHVAAKHLDNRVRIEFVSEMELDFVDHFDFIVKTLLWWLGLQKKLLQR